MFALMQRLHSILCAATHMSADLSRFCLCINSWLWLSMEVLGMSIPRLTVYTLMSLILLVPCTLSFPLADLPYSQLILFCVYFLLIVISSQIFCSCKQKLETRLYGLALNERIEKLPSFEIHFRRSGMKT